MGRLFIEHPGGEVIYSCQSCDTPLTNKNELLSQRFTGATGSAYLFSSVKNITTGTAEGRLMLTGRHLVRDVHCKCCAYKLGWMYEFASEDAQMYKEGKVILERALITESRGFANSDSESSENEVDDTSSSSDT